RLVGEDQKDRLAGVLGVLLRGQHPPADAEHHRQVAAHHGRERRLVAALGEAPEQLAVGQGEGFRPDLPHRPGHGRRPFRHDTPSSSNLAHVMCAVAWAAARNYSSVSSGGVTVTSPSFSSSPCFAIVCFGALRNSGPYRFLPFWNASQNSC